MPADNQNPFADLFARLGLATKQDMDAMEGRLTDLVKSTLPTAGQVAQLTEKLRAAEEPLRKAILQASTTNANPPAGPQAEPAKG